MADPRRPVYRIGEIEVDTIQGCVRRGSEELHLRPRTMQVLLYVLEQRHRLVSRDELLTKFWKDTAVTDDALAQCMADIRRVFGDSSRASKVLKTVPKFGYRWIAAVEEVGGPHASPGTITTEESITTELEIEEVFEGPDPINLHPVLPLPRPRWQSRRFRVATAAIALAAGTIVAAVVIGRPDSVPAPSASLAGVAGKTPVVVMYLENQSKSEELDWLREGLADMLIANLSRASQLAVLSRPELHVVLQNIGHASGESIGLPDALEVARISHAGVVALGSFATFGKMVRVTVQLHDAATGRLQATESVNVAESEQIPTQMDVLSVKLAAHLGAVMALNDDRAPFLPVMTDDLEAYRYYSLAVERVNALDNMLAIQLLEKAIALDPGFAMAHARIGFAYAVTGFDPDRGRPYLERAFRLTERLTERDRLLITAWYAIANLDYAGAIESFRHIIASYPAETNAYLRLGLLLRGEDKPAEAIEVIERGLALDPHADEALRELGMLYLEVGDQSRAISWLTKAVSAAPKVAVGHERLATAFRWFGRYDEAAESYRRALALNPGYEDAALGLGNLSYDRGRYREALAEYQRHLQRLEPGSRCANVYRFSATVYLRLSDLDRAEQLMTKAMRCDPTAYWNALVIAHQRGQREKVARLLAQVEVDPPPGRGVRTSRRFQARARGMIALWNGRNSEALEQFKQALRHRPPVFNIESLEDCLANAYLQLGRLDEAIAEYQRVLGINPNDALSRYHLGLVYEQKGMRTESRAQLEQFLQIWKDADADLPELRDAISRLGPGATR